MTKLVITYECEFCGRKKIVRFNKVPTPASYKTCPKCKEGRLLSPLALAGAKECERLYAEEINKQQEEFLRKEEPYLYD